MNKFPKINQQTRETCAYASILNILGLNDYPLIPEYELLNQFRINFQKHKITATTSLFNAINQVFDDIIPDLKCKYQHCQGSLDVLIDFIKTNIDNQIPILIAIKAEGMIKCTHIVCVVGYDDQNIKIFDPSPNYNDILEFNYQNNEFINILQDGLFDTLIIYK